MILKIAAGAALASVLGLLYRRSNPEMTLLLEAVTLCCVLIAAGKSLSGFRDLLEQVNRLSPKLGDFTGPLLRCTGIAILTKLSADLCRDSAQTALAGAVELAGSICALAVSLPIVMSVLKLLGDLI